jgi:hypothetical protein
MDLEPRRTVASTVARDADEFGVLIDYGNGEGRKYRVGTRDEARKELECIGFDKPGRPFLLAERSSADSIKDRGSAV